MILTGKSEQVLKTLTKESIDLICTDPPFGYSFMGKDWDKAVPSVQLWKECLRVMKPGAFAFVMSAPRQDVLSRMIINMTDAGFDMSFTSIYWTYATGFPKASNIAKNISKDVDKMKMQVYNCSLWNTHLNDATTVGQKFVKSLIDAGLLTNAKDFVVSRVMGYFSRKKLHANVSIVEKKLSEVRLMLREENIFIVVENAEPLTKLSSLAVATVVLKSADLDPLCKVQIVFVPINVHHYLCESIENQIKEGEAQKTENGNLKSLEKTIINVLCAKVINGLKRITLNQLKNILSLGIISRMEQLSVTNVIITKSIRECLTLSTANTVGKEKNWGKSKLKDGKVGYGDYSGDINITEPSTEQAKKLNGSYAGFQPKPAVEVIIVAMKPIRAKTYAGQALRNGHGCTWLDDGRIPYQSKQDIIPQLRNNKRCVNSREMYGGNSYHKSKTKAMIGGNVLGRFPANLLVSDNVLDTGKITKGQKSQRGTVEIFKNNGGWRGQSTERGFNDEGDYSRYFSLDAWAGKQNFPFFITSKPSQREKNRGCSELEVKQSKGGGGMNDVEAGRKFGSLKIPSNNFHPTVKPMVLMSYLITIGSRPGDLILDPFCGSGTTGVAAINLLRKFIGIDMSEEFSHIAKTRLNHAKKYQKF